MPNYLKEVNFMKKSIKRNYIKDISKIIINKVRININKISPMLEKGRINSIYFDNLIVQ